MVALVDLRGRRFGRLTVTGRAFGHASGNAVWAVICDCGNVREVRGNNLTRGAQVSCGCYRAQNNKTKSITHGKSASAEFNIWMKIKGRCLNPSDRAFKDYGARGISICPEWSVSFEAFYADMGPRPSSKHSIDRKDNDKGYHPGNCRWATPKEQARNRRSNIHVEHCGQRRSLSDLADEIGMSRDTLAYRIKAGWSVDDAVSVPPRSPR